MHLLVCMAVSATIICLGVSCLQGTASSGYDSDDDLSMSRASDSFSAELSPELRGESFGSCNLSVEE